MADQSPSHDSFVRAILADRQVAADYFRAALPEQIARQLDFSTLRPLPDSYVSRDLRKTTSDVLYSCRTAYGGSVEISFLLEHKSAPDKFAPLQIGSYLLSGYRQQVKQGRKKLTPIIPILLYHGKRKWKYRTMKRLFEGTEKEMLDYIPNFQYVYNDLRERTDEEIQALANRFLAASLLALKHAFDGEWLKGNMAAVLKIGLPHGDGELSRSLLLYYFGRVELSEEQLEEVIRELPTDIKEGIMSTYDLLLEKGIEKGAEQKSYQVVSNLILAGRFTTAEIANFATVTEEFVEKVLVDLSKKEK